MAAKVTTNLGGSSVTPSAPATGFYRVRKSWADAKSQNGAFKSLDNARKCAASNLGYYVFDANGKVVNEIGISSTKTIDELAKEVIKGVWGSGADRKARLTAAGYDYAKVQKRVNKLLK